MARARWADPVWRAMMIAKLRAAAATPYGQEHHRRSLLRANAVVRINLPPAELRIYKKLRRLAGQVAARKEMGLPPRPKVPR
jgi:hypothetical protein